MKISRLFLAILLILILALIVFEVSNKGSGIGEDDDGVDRAT